MKDKIFSYEDVVNYWQSKKINTDAELAEVLNGHSIAFAYHSCKIENDKITYNDTRDIFDRDGVTSYTGDLRTLFEIRNAKIANEFFLTSFNNKRSIDLSFLRELHEKLTQNTYDTRRWQLGERPGHFKHHDYVTGKEEIGAAPNDVEEEITELLSELCDIPSDKILIAAAYLHAKFENIHPFADGNGRTGRLLMNYFLVLNGYPPIIIHEEDRNDYYLSLEVWDREQDLEPLCKFLKNQAIKTWLKQLSKPNLTKTNFRLKHYI